MELLLKYFELKSGIDLTGADKELIAQRFKLKRLKKKQYLLQEGDICKYISFIVKGAARSYSVDERGIEHILYLGIEGWWMGDNESFTLHTASRYNIDMLEDTELLIITQDHLKELIEKLPAVASTMATINNNRVIAAEKRIHAALSQTPEQRFDVLSNDYPDLLKRFPLTMIASYIGISTKTLGRIRNGGK